MKELTNRRTRRLATAAATVGGILTLCLAGSINPARANGSSLACDFNEDGKADTVIGIPGRNVAQKEGAGAFAIRYTSGGGLLPVLYTQAGGALQGPAAGNRFGSSFACGDFNGDGHQDLAIGVPGYKNDGGAVAIYLGNGSEVLPTSLWSQNSTGIEGVREDGDLFGFSLAAGDFNGDSKDDLAIGVPGENVAFEGTWDDLGAVNVLRGANGGLTATGNKIFHPGTVSVGDVMRRDGARFGHALAAGDFNDDGIADLAVGMPGAGMIEGRTDEHFERVGAVSLLVGKANSGLAKDGQLWKTFWLGTTPNRDERFGFALAVGDFDNNGVADLAIGAPQDWLGHDFECHANVCEAQNPLPGIGAVHVRLNLASNDGHLKPKSYYTLSQDTPGVPGSAENFDRFGFSLAAGNFDGQYGDDLAVGVPGENKRGVVNVIYSGPEGLVPEHAVYDGSDAGAADQEGQGFGYAVAAADMSGDGVDDLMIGIPNHTTTELHAGAVVTLSGQNVGGLGVHTYFHIGSPFFFQKWVAEHNTFSWAYPDDDWLGENEGERFGNSLR